MHVPPCSPPCSPAGSMTRASRRTMEKALPCNWPKRRPSSQKVGVDTAMLEEACPRKLRLKQKTERVSKLYVKTGTRRERRLTSYLKHIF
jgi:hypothetical protein